ncbi:MAG: Methyltransferase type 11 [Marmoricola sp.]|jgi:hypothetical protein|nr:Methyltransferase type 11 [Marmoricola sp.]
MYYLDFFTSVHEQLQPQAYLEIGVAEGKCLRLSRCRTVGIDPGFALVVPIDGDIALFRTTSDEYFSRDNPLEPTQGRPFDMAFIDGLHLFEFALRDFINTERNSSPNGLIIFDDVLPRSVKEAARARATNLWTGDVYPILEVLAKYRPGLSVLPVDTWPTGLLLVTGLDPEDTTLADHYDEIVAQFRRPDPQPVPEDLMDRLTVLQPEMVLESGFLEILRDQREDVAAMRGNLATTLREKLGSDFAPVG